MSNLTGLPARRAVPVPSHLDMIDLRVMVMSISADLLILRIMLGFRKSNDQPNASIDEQYPEITYGASAFFRN